jgi:hypothetical protein
VTSGHVPGAIDGGRLPDRDHFYDQIATRMRDDRFSEIVTDFTNAYLGPIAAG